MLPTLEVGVPANTLHSMGAACHLGSGCVLFFAVLSQPHSIHRLSGVPVANETD